MILSSFVLLIFEGCATLNSKGKVVKITIKPFQAYEKCLELLPNQILEYSFNSSEPLKFNVHYHAKKDDFYAVSENNITDWKGSFSPAEHKYYSKNQKYYCLMWENPSSDRNKILIKYTVKNK